MCEVMSLFIFLLARLVSGGRAGARPSGRYIDIDIRLPPSTVYRRLPPSTWVDGRRFTPQGRHWGRAYVCALVTGRQAAACPGSRSSSCPADLPQSRPTSPGQHSHRSAAAGRGCGQGGSLRPPCPPPPCPPKGRASAWAATPARPATSRLRRSRGDHGWHDRRDRAEVERRSRGGRTAARRVERHTLPRRGRS